MAVLLANNATSRLASSLTAAATTLSVTSGEGARFPSPTGDQWFPLTVITPAGALEIMRCTARSGDVLTVTRAQEGTAAQAFSAGDRVELRLTNAAIAEFGQKSNANTWIAKQTYSSGMDSAARLTLGNGTSDSPELAIVTPSHTVHIDVAADSLRAFKDGGASFPFEFNLATGSTKFFGNEAWHAGNFNPTNYLPATGKAVDSDKLDGIDSTGFLRPGIEQPTNGTKFSSSLVPKIASTTGSAGAALEILNGGNPDASATITFNRINAYAVHFGLDTDNKLKVGGWSMGTKAYEIWHDQNGEGKVMGATANRAAGDVGSYAFLKNVSGAGISPGQLIAGSSLRYSDTSNGGSGAAPGTWRCMGACPNYYATLFLRAS